MGKLIFDSKPKAHKPTMETERILIIRSATRVFNKTLEALKSEFPESQIAVLTPEINQENLEADPLVDEVKVFPANKRMGILSCGGKMIRELRSRQFDLAVSLYNVERGIGYSNIDLLAWVVKPKAIRGYNSKGTFVSLTGYAILEKMIQEKTSGLWIIANFVATVALFSFITMGIMGEWLFRKLFQNEEFDKTVK